MSTPVAPASAGAVPSVTLVDQLRRVQALRLQRALLVEQRRRADEQFATDHAALFAATKQLQAELEQQEAQARTLALALYQQDPTTKQPAPGVTIKVMRVLPDYDAKAALAWAKQKGVALKLDAKLFETIALDSAEPLLVGLEPHDEPRATLATDLGKVLADISAAQASPLPLPEHTP